jgi:hypothetical protein
MRKMSKSKPARHESNGFHELLWRTQTESGDGADSPVSDASSISPTGLPTPAGEQPPAAERLDPIFNSPDWRVFGEQDERQEDDL